MSRFLDDMAWRGQVQQCTDEDGLRKHLALQPDKSASRRAYVGFDPTADSLTIGNLVGIMALAHWQRAGHTPVAVMGGGTGLIGDPSGKTAERQLRTREEIEANVASIERIFGGSELFDGGRGGNGLLVRNNIEWLARLSFLDALRDVGKHFSVNMMVQKDSVKERLTNRDQGISYTEFSYMILQAYDFAWLHEHEGVTVQMGGSDQFGNIVVGMDLISKQQARADAANEKSHEKSGAFGLTWPLVTKADGTKFGKTETGAIWLTGRRGAGDTSPARTSPYAYYQFWLNAADADVERFLRTFTLVAQEEVAALGEKVRTNPGAREAQRTLAREATRILHGPTEMQRAEDAAGALFSGEVQHLPLATLEEALASAPSSTHARAQLEGAGVPLLDMLVTTKLATSRREAKEFLQNGSVSVNGKKAGAEDALTTRDLLHGSIIAIRRGKKLWHVTRWG